ncbi:MAG: hypothetical protein GVY24_07915 [Planctomycetes bacterium]|nr:hypothetical protein [Planctomycetota bacterium]
MRMMKCGMLGAWVVGLMLGLNVAVTSHAAGPAMAASGDASAEPLVLAEALADHAAVAPGQTFMLGVRLTMRPGWHIYWRNPGDSGQATTINVTAEGVDGIEVGDIRWPLPHRFELDGGLTNYGYDGTVMLTRKITLPDDLGDAGQITLSIDASWLVCEATCIPGGRSLALTLPVAEQPRASTEHAEALGAHEAALPAEPEALSDRVSLHVTGGIDPESNQGVWRLVVDWKDRVPTDVEWFPATDDALMLGEASIDTAEGTTTIRQPAQRLAGMQPAADTLLMLVAWREPDGQRRGMRIPVPLMAPPERAAP